MNSVGRIYGIPIYLNDLLIRDTPVRKHKFPVARWPWRRNVLLREVARHERIQKKWNKRFGVKREPYALQSRNAYFMHPEYFRELQLSIQKSEHVFLNGQPGALVPREGGILGKKATGVFIDEQF